MFDEIWKVLVGLGGFSGLCVAAGVAIKKYIDKYIEHRWSKDLEAHKTRLKDTSDRELERIRAELRQAAFHYETRFGRLHEKMFDALVEIHPALYELYLSVGSYVAVFEWSAEPSKDEKLADVQKKWDAFRQLYILRQVLIPKELSTKVDEITGLLTNVTRKFSSGNRNEGQGRRLPDVEVWHECFETVSSKVKPLMDEVKDKVQELLGHEILAAKKV